MLFVALSANFKRAQVSGMARALVRQFLAVVVQFVSYTSPVGQAGSPYLNADMFSILL